MLNNFPLLSCGRTAKLGCYAGIAGTGPKDEICARCAHQVPAGTRFVCSKYTDLTRRQGKPIDPHTAACRYFSKRPSFASAHAIAAE